MWTVDKREKWTKIIIMNGKKIVGMSRKKMRAKSTLFSRQTQNNEKLM